MFARVVPLRLHSLTVYLTVSGNVVSVASADHGLWTGDNGIIYGSDGDVVGVAAREPGTPLPEDIALDGMDLPEGITLPTDVALALAREVYAEVLFEWTVGLDMGESVTVEMANDLVDELHARHPSVGYERFRDVLVRSAGWLVED